jgi:glycine oxidase
MNSISGNLKSDCHVIGGGIIGMLTARELALRGFSVSLFDKGRLGMESSWAAGGILSSMRIWSEHPSSAELSNEGKACYADLVAELKQQTGIDAEYYRSGMLMINKSDVEHTRQWAEKNRLSFYESYEDHPTNMHIPAYSIFLPEIAQLRVPRLLKALHASLIKLGVSIFENTAITGMDIKEGICKSIQAGSETYYADSFIISAGAWSQKVCTTNTQSISIKPVMGQMLCMKFVNQQLETMVLDGEHYLIPRKDGHVLIGSTMEDVGFAKETTQTARNNLMQWACALWPDIAEADFIKHWSGLRPATDNGKPYLGKLKDHENVYINAGHFRKGILQAPVCARKIAEMLC